MSLENLRTQLLDKVLGSQKAVDLLLIALLARGHALVTGPPGIGKTTLAKTLAGLVGSSFRRIQFTPDLLPSDILGYNLYRQQSGEFEFIPGPIFTNLLLADEINRASPRTQSSLLEAMNEKQVTIDGTTLHLPNPFLVVATQNDTSSTGTFPLPEPQLDRFLLSIPMTLPSDDTQLDILKLHTQSNNKEEASTEILSLDHLQKLQDETSQILVSENLQRYLLALCQTVRSMVGQDHAVSTRATLALQQASQAAALLDGQSAVYPDHVQNTFPYVLRHRLLTDHGANLEQILISALEQTPVP